MWVWTFGGQSPPKVHQCGGLLVDKVHQKSTTWWTFGGQSPPKVHHNFIRMTTKRPPNVHQKYTNRPPKGHQFRKCLMDFSYLHSTKCEDFLQQSYARLNEGNTKRVCVCMHVTTHDVILHHNFARRQCITCCHREIATELAV